MKVLRAIVRFAGGRSRALGLVVLLGAGVLCGRATGGEAPLLPGWEAAAKLAPARRGLLLAGELNCTSCHAPAAVLPLARPKPAPLLADAANRIRHQHLVDFIGDPLAVKPGTTMPDTLADLPANEKAAAARALAQYLISIAVKPPDPEGGDAEVKERGSVERGKALFHQVGCAACHAPESQPDLPGSAPLGAPEQKYHPAALVGFLEDPLAVRPGGRMPSLRLDHFEAVDLAAYLLRDAPGPTPDLAPARRLAEQGKRLFVERGCAACHALDGVAAQPARPWRELHPDQGCLSGRVGAWPRYALTRSQRDALDALLRDGPPEPDLEGDIRLTLARFNCAGCHQRGDFGGIPADRDEFFTTRNLNLGEQGRRPPPLTLVGAKLQPDWLHKVLVLGDSVRPYMNTRMPVFGGTNVVHLVEWFGQADHLPPAEFTRNPDPREARKVGRELVGNHGLNCIACHTFKNESASNIRALEMTTMAARLRENWFHHYLQNPGQFRPMIIMPTYWPEGASPLQDVLDGDRGRQIDALWQYLAEGRNAGSPRGLVLEPLPLVVRDEAVMLRRNYPGIGKRGIGVGYPGGVNLSFDAGQMRLGWIWRGGFIEASPVWRGQGAGMVRILGTNIVRFPVGPAFAVLPALDTPWPEDDHKKAPGFQFRGYTLDAQQRPTFSYAFGDLRIRDRFLNVRDADGRAFLRRTLGFDSPALPAHLWFRAAVADVIEETAPGRYQVGKLLELRVPGPARIRDRAQGKELLVPLGDRAQVSLEYHW